MHTFVWKAKDADGREVVQQVRAETGEESRRVLLEDGYTDLVLKEDEICDVTTSAMQGARLFDEEIKVTAEQRLKYRDKKPLTLLSALAEGMWNSKSILAIIICVGAYGLFFGNRMSVVCSVIALIAWMAFLIVISLPLIYYRRLHRASDWHRWDEVESLVNTLEAIGRFHFIKIPPPELGRYRAKVAAARGNLASALRDYQKYENLPGCPGWLHKAFVASIYDLVKQHDKALEYTLLAIAEKPSPVLYLDLANRYARHKKDPFSARDALVEAEKSPLPDATIPSLHRFKGEVAYLEGNYPLAKEEIETAIRLMEATPHVPFRDGNINVAKAYLCCVLARLGDFKGAEKNYREAERYLRATNETELMAECRAELEHFHKICSNVPEV